MLNMGRLPGIHPLERTLAGIQSIMKSMTFDTKEKEMEFRNELISKGIPETDRPMTPAETAQELIYEANEREDVWDRVLLAYEALSVYPDCADALNLLALEKSKNKQEELEFYLKAEEAGLRTLGGDFITEHKGALWEATEARPYLRAMEGTANALWRNGRKHEAMAKCREMLELNAADNQGIRYTLMSFLSEERKYHDLEIFLKNPIFSDESGVEWYYMRALVSYAMHGETNGSRKYAEEAIRRNPHVIKYIAGFSKMPDDLPDKYTPKSEEEAVIYAANNISAWFKVDNAFEWLVDTATEVLGHLK